LRENSVKRWSIVHPVREIQQADEKYYTKACKKTEELKNSGYWFAGVLGK